MLSSKRISPDYSTIASGYDARYKYNALPGVGMALAELAAEKASPRVLEVGCGTGHWLLHLAPCTGHRTGLDFSHEMLLRAREKEQGLPLVRASAEALPFREATFDLVFCVNALPHFPQPQRFIEEAGRVLAPGGTLAVIGRDPRLNTEQTWHYQYFPETWDADLARFPSWGTVADWMLQAGFRELAWRPVERLVDPKVGREMLSNPWLHKNSSSQLALLSEEAYRAGLARVEAAIADAGARGEEVVFPMDVTLALLVGRKGPA